MISSVLFSSPVIGSGHSDGKIYNLKDIFGESIQFADLCDQANFGTHGEQTVSSPNQAERYFNFERVYTHAGNEINVKFNFYDAEKRLYQNVWEKYLINYSLMASDNMLIQIKVTYNGETYTNARVTGKLPFRYEENTYVEMNRIDYHIEPEETCPDQLNTVIAIESNLEGVIYNESGNRAIRLEGVRLKFQVFALDTARLKVEIPKNAIIIKPELKYNPDDTFYMDTLREIRNLFPGAEIGVAYDMPSIAWRGKPFVILSRTSLIFRLSPGDFDEALALEGSKFFNPLGQVKPLANWVQIHLKHRKRYREFAQKAASFAMP